VAEQRLVAGVESAALWLLVGTHGVDEEAEPVVDVVMEALAGGDDSMLALAMAQAGVAAHTVRLGVVRWPEGARFRVLIRCPPSALALARAVVERTLERVRAEGLGREELARAKGSVFHDVEAAWSTMDGIFAAVLRAEVRGKGVEQVLGQVRDREMVTDADVSRWAPVFLGASAVSWLEIAPPKTEPRKTELPPAN
jgi:hypothetical protein